MSNYEVDPNIKQILDLKINKGVFPLTVDSAVIAHSPNGETTYLDSVVDYLYQQIANKLRLYTEQDGAYTKGKAYPATMGVQNANNINALQGTVNNYASILSALQQQVNDIDPTDDITSINNTIQRLWGILNNLSEASEYSYQEIKFSDSQTLPPNDLDNTTYWKTRPMDNPQHLWLGIRTITIKRGEDGRPIITRGDAMIVSLQGPKGEKGDKGDKGDSGKDGTGIPGIPGKSYRPVLMYKWTSSRTVGPNAPTNPQSEGWTESPNNPEGENKYLWMTQNYIDIDDSTYVNPTWSTPVCLSGDDGVGSDGKGIEFIFFRTNNIDYTPTVNDLNAYKNGDATQQGYFKTDDFPFIGTDGANIVSGNQWTDNPQGIQLDAKYEWASFRQSNNGEWDYFCAPFRWSMWGEDGIDGDGVEYIYYRCNDANKWGKYPGYQDGTDPRNWSHDPQYQDPEYIRDDVRWDGTSEGIGWSDDPRGVGASAMYEYVSIRKTQAVDGSPNKKEWGVYSQPVLWAKFGKDGKDGQDAQAASQGLSGPVVRFRGEYDPAATPLYENSSLDTQRPATDIRYIDVVYVVDEVNNQTNYYMVKSEAGGTKQTRANPETSDDWEQATGYSFIAAEALYARHAHIDNLSGYEFVVQDNNNHVVAGMTGSNVTNSVVNSSNNSASTPVRIWAGSDAENNINLQDDNIPFKVFQDGKLKATNAEIKGDLSIDSLLLTGNEGSYYYNKSAITLPKINDDNHKVIFIITAGTGTIVSASTGDVLFAFSNNNMQTTNSTTLSTYKIYLAISINNGQNSGWLLQNLNALELQASMGTVSRDIIEDLVVENGYWTIYSDVREDQMKLYLYLNRNLGNIYSFTTINTSSPSYPSATNPVFSIQGNIDFEKENGDHLATLYLDPMQPQGISNLGSGEQSGYITMGSIIDTYNEHENDTPKKIYLDGTEWTIHIYSNPNDHTQDYIEILMPLKEGIDGATPIKAIPSISLIESFNYVATTNNAAPATTSTVSSNGFVIKDGSIVATDMPEGATVNMKDCIVYKDVTGTAANNQYEVVNFGTSNITIGNRIVNPNEAIIVKAKPNTQIDFSDITAIDASDIYDIDPAEQGDPVNH